MPDVSCLTDEELLPASCREPVSEAVRAHLISCPSCRQRLKRLGAELEDLRGVCQSFTDRGEEVFHIETETVPRTPSEPGASVLRPPEPVPSAVGRYPVVRLLAVEEQASVFLGRHPSLDRDVVIKVSHHRVSAAGADRDRLIREARLLEGLGDQPYLVRVHDLNFHDDRPFLVMDFVRGQNLQQHAERTQYAPLDAARLVAKLARGVAGPHRLGVIHRDLKPKNVLIDPAGEPRVLDFGLASDRVHWTENEAGSGSLGGTVGYVAPEQARGELGRVDARTDVFALGGILYFLITGRVPFGGPTPSAALERARACDFDRDALKGADIPPRLAAVCLKAMAAEPVDRHSSAEALAVELERLARPTRFPWPVFAAITCAVIALGLGVWAWRQFVGPSGNEPTTVPSKTIPGPQYLLEINGQSLGTLNRPLPLREGDRLKVRCDVPRGLTPALFWLDADGNLAEPEGAEVTSAEAFNQLLYPASGQAVKLTQPKASGTVLALVCAGEQKPQLKHVREAWVEASRRSRRESAALPLLPRDAVLTLDRDTVRALAHRSDWDKPEQDALAEVEDCLNKLRLLLNRYPFVTGVAVGFLR